MKRLIPLAAFALLLGLPLAGVASTPIDKTVAVDPDAQIEVANVRGAVKVSGWDRPEVAVTGTLGDGAKALRVEGGGGNLRIKVEGPGSEGIFGTRMDDSVLDIKVPRSAQLTIKVVSASVSLADVGGKSLTVNSVSGKLDLDSAAAELNLDSVSGNVNVSGSATRSHLQSVSGDIRARGLAGQVKLETVSGDLDLQAASYGEVDASSVSGDIRVRGTPIATARVDVQSMSGDAQLVLPADVGAHIQAETFSGDIRSDFGTVSRAGHGPRQQLDATVGTGAGRFSIKTFSGDIRIDRQ